MVVNSNTVTSSSSSARKSRPLRRKTSHSVIERRRREKINEGLIALQATVPACREELEALLLVKAQSDRRNARKCKDVIAAEVRQTMKEKMSDSMMLEKLCIISHTVDYVNELRRIVDAYRTHFQCEPIAVLAAQLQHPAMTNGDKTEENDKHAKLHSEMLEGSDASDNEHPASPPLTPSERSSSTSVVPIDAENDEKCKGCDSALCGAKRQRHWGSNNPMHIDRVQSQKRKRIENSQKTSVKDNVVDDGSEDEEGLELDDWQDRQCMRRHSHRSDIIHTNPTSLYAADIGQKAFDRCTDCDRMGKLPRQDKRTERERRLDLLASLSAKSM